MAKIGDIYVAINARLDKFEKDLKKAQASTKRSSGKMQRSFDKLNLKKARSSLLSFNKMLIAATAGYGMARLAKSFVDAANTSEGFAIRLKSLLGSVEEGNRLFKEMSEFAGQVPFTYEQIMSSATQLAGVMRGGTDEIKRWMPMIADLAAVSGLSIEDTTMQIVRMYSAGAAAADLFRDRGITAMLGFQAKTQYSAKETRRMLWEAYNDPLSKFRDSTKDLAKTWSGTMSMIEDKWFQFRNLIMDAGVYDVLKSGLADIDEKFGDWIENNKELIKQEVPKYVDSITDAINSLLQAMKDLKGFHEQHNQDLNKVKDMAADAGEAVNLFFGGSGKAAHLWVKETRDAVDKYKHEMHRLRATLYLEDPLSAPAAPAGKTKKLTKGKAAIEKVTIPFTLSDADMVKSLDEMFGIQQEHHEKLIDEWEDYEDAIKEAEEEKWKFLESLAQETQLEKILREKKEKELEEAEKQSEFMITLSERTANAMEQTFSDVYFDAMTAELTSFQDYFEAFANSLKRMWADILGQMTKEWIMSFLKMGQSSGGGNAGGFFSSIASAFSAMGGSAGGGAAPTGGPAAGMGAVFTPHGMSAFARGGVVDRPTIFPFANGTGLMGERGPEGILPLKRTASGELGVKSEETGAKSANVSFNIYAIDTQSGTDFLMKNAQSIAMAVNDELEGGNRGLIRNLRMVR